MKSIFISYRRDDGIETAQLLQMHLEKMFGENDVFLDTDTIQPGDEFPIKIREAINASKVVIVMIGPKWKGTDADVNRFEHEYDWVRKELEFALQDGKRKIFPVLVKEATSGKSFAGLPPSLAQIAKLNSTSLREKEFKQDILPLIQLIERNIQPENPLKDLPLNDNYLYPSGSPFKGLSYFTEKDARIFFGRGNEIKKIFYKIKNSRLLFLYGRSGCGKSSLLFAGLKPRMEKKGWKIKYLRREPGINLAEDLRAHVSQIHDDSKYLVILDQVEEIFTNPDFNLPSDVEALQLLASINSIQNENELVHVVLSFRKEYLAEIKKLFYGLTIEEVYLEALQTKGILEAIRGITDLEEARELYEIEFADEQVPIAIAQSVSYDDESEIAPLLQVLLRKMWDKVENKRPRTFSRELLEEVKSNSLIALIIDQIASVGATYKDEAASGMLLDILYYFTTQRGTSASHTKEELISNYNKPGILKIANELKNKYLLSEPKNDDSNTLGIMRLAHDSLAPLIRELYAQSSLPVQRASRLLESKKNDIEQGVELEFSKVDLAIIDAGTVGMRTCTEKEREVIELSRQRIHNYEMELEERNQQLEAALKEAKEQTLQARAKALAATARKKLQTDPTIALRLAEAACKLTPSATTEAQSALVDILAYNSGFYKKRFEGHKAGIKAVAFSPDGKSILSGSNDSTAILWKWDGTVKRTFEEHKSFVQSVAFSLDGKYILTGSSDCTAVLWNLDGTIKQTFTGHTGEVLCVAISSDSQLILTGSGDATARLWSLDGTLIMTFEKNRRVTSVLFSPDDKWILTAGGQIAYLWNLEGDLKQSFEGHSGEIHSIAFSPDSKFILTGSLDANLWSLDGTLQQSFAVDDGYITSIAISPDGKYVVTGTNDKETKVWYLGGRLKHTLISDWSNHTTNKSSVDFGSLYQSVNSVAISPDGKFILTAHNDHFIRLWNFEGGALKQSFEGHMSSVSCATFSPDNTHILTGSLDNTAKLWNLEGTVEQSFNDNMPDYSNLFTGHVSGISSVTFSPDGKHILTGSLDGRADLWNPDGTLRRSFIENNVGVASVAFSPDSKFILTGSCDLEQHISLDGTIKRSGADKSAKLWNMNGIIMQTFHHTTDGISSVAFSPDGNKILTVGLDKTAKLWSLDGELIQTFETHESAITLVVSSSDGVLVLTVSNDKTARLWDLNGVLLQTFEVHTGGVTSVAFSPDRKFILSGSKDGTVKLCNLKGVLMQTFPHQLMMVNSVSFSSDGKSILMGSGNSTARLWSPFWEILNPENTYVLNLDEMKEYDIPEDLEWGKLW